MFYEMFKKIHNYNSGYSKVLSFISNLVNQNKEQIRKLVLTRRQIVITNTDKITILT